MKAEAVNSGRERQDGAREAAEGSAPRGSRGDGQGAGSGVGVSFLKQWLDTDVTSSNSLNLDAFLVVLAGPGCLGNPVFHATG